MRLVVDGIGVDARTRLRLGRKDLLDGLTHRYSWADQFLNVSDSSHFAEVRISRRLLIGPRLRESCSGTNE